MIISLIEKQEGDVEIWSGAIRLTLAGVDIGSKNITHNFRGLTRSRHVLSLGIPITQPGELEVSLDNADGGKMLSHYIDIKVKSEIRELEKEITKSSTVD